MVIEVVTWSSGMPSKRISMSRSVEMATPSLPTSPRRHRVVGVVAHERRHVEGGGEPRRAVRHEVLEALVGVLRRAEAGEHPHRPQPAAVHRRLHAAGERELSGEPEVAEVLAGPLGRSDHGGDGDARVGHELRAARRRAGAAPRDLSPLPGPLRRGELPHGGGVIGPEHGAALLGLGGGLAGLRSRRAGGPGALHEAQLLRGTPDGRHGHPGPLASGSGPFNHSEFLEVPGEAGLPQGAGASDENRAPRPDAGRLLLTSDESAPVLAQSRFDWSKLLSFFCFCHIRFA